MHSISSIPVTKNGKRAQGMRVFLPFSRRREKGPGVEGPREKVPQVEGPPEKVPRNEGPQENRRVMRVLLIHP